MYTPITPSSLFSASDPKTSNSAFTQINQNFGLKTGVIIKSYDIDDKDNYSKENVEYDIITADKKPDGSASTSVLKRCIFMDSFGSVADFFESKLRVPKNNDMQKKGDINNYDGAVVLVLCLNGDSERGIIIGCVRHPKRKTSLTKEAGLQAKGEYNGVSWEINKDGELTVVFKSATDEKGKPKNEASGGSYYKMDKDGSITVGNQVPLEGKQDQEVIKLDKKEKKITAKSSGNVEFTAEDEIKAEAKGNVTIKSGKDFLAEIQGRATTKAMADFTLEVGGNVQAKGSSFNVQSDSSFIVQASTVQLNSSSIILGQGGTPAVTFNTIYIGTGNLGAPVVSRAVGPFSSTVIVGN